MAGARDVERTGRAQEHVRLDQMVEGRQHVDVHMQLDTLDHVPKRRRPLVLILLMCLYLMRHFSLCRPNLQWCLLHVFFIEYLRLR